MTLRVFGPEVDPRRAALILLMADEWVNGTVLHYCFFDQDSDGGYVFFADGTREWRTWAGRPLKNGGPATDAYPVRSAASTAATMLIVTCTATVGTTEAVLARTAPSTSPKSKTTVSS